MAHNMFWQIRRRLTLVLSVFILCIWVLTSNQYPTQERYDLMLKSDNITRRISNWNNKGTLIERKRCHVESGDIVETVGSTLKCKYNEDITPCQENTFQQVGDYPIYVYSAYFTKNLVGQKEILIITMKRTIDIDIYCVLSYKDGTVLNHMGSFKNIDIPEYQKYFKFIPVFIKCPEVRGEKPVSVSIATDHCGSLNNSLEVTDRTNQNSNKRDRYGICTKHIFNYKSAASLVEWIEMQRIMGINEIIMYDYENVSLEVRTVIEHYKLEGYLIIQPWEPSKIWTSSKLPQEGGDIHTHGQFALNNDCLWRYGHKYKYMMFLDPDEYIIPSKTYPRLLPDIFNKLMNKPTYSSRSFKHCLFCVNTSLEKDQEFVLQTQQFTMRQLPLIEYQTKTVINPPAVYVMGVHEAKKIYPGFLGDVEVEPHLVKLHHYRDPRELKQYSQHCDIIDYRARRYGSELQKNVQNILKITGIQYK